jgi:phosphomannomutase
MPAPTKTVYRFGTSGWRAIDEFTEDAVCQITNAFADYLIETMEGKGRLLPVMLGGDTRDKTRRFIPLIAQLLVQKGIDVLQCDSDVPSPVLAYAAKYVSELHLGVAETLGAILMTASHNPWPYGGYNFLTPDGAVMGSAVSKRVEALQETPKNLSLSLDDRKRLGGAQAEAASVRFFNPYEIYKNHLVKNLKIDFSAIRDSGIHIHYDPLFATGRQYLPRILKEEAGLEIQIIHGTDQRPDGYTGMPEPTGSELTELAVHLRSDAAPLKVGLANDGDSDRFGVLDETGRYVNPNEVLLLVLHHLIENKKQRGVVVRSQATTNMLDALAARYDLPVVQTPVGYKYIAGEFEKHEEHPEGPQVLIGGESSGGLSVLGHLPEKDGILANLLVAELIAVEKRPLSQILERVQSSLGQRYVFRELGVKTEKGTQIREAFQKLQAVGGQLAGMAINTQASEGGSQKLEVTYGTRDGAKLIFEDGSWLLIRASGTEPVVRVYVEAVAPTPQAALEKSQGLVDATCKMLSQDFGVPPENIKEKK